MAKIIANGNEIETGQLSRLSEWLHSLGWKSTQVVIELNGEVLNKSNVNDVELRSGDRLEIVFPVAGG